MPSDKRERLIFWLCAALLLLFTAMLTKYDVTMAGNESSRFGVIQALAEQNTFAINRTVFRSVDRIIIDGRIYSDKPLMMMVVHGMMFKALIAITGISFDTHYYLAVYLTNLLGIGLLNIVLFVLFFKRLEREVKAPFYSKLFLSAALLLSTLLLTYGVAMNNHTPAALVLFVLFLQLMDYPRRNSSAAAFMIGITAGILVNLEIPIGGLFGLSSCLIVLLLSGARKWQKTAVYAIGGLLPIFMIGLVNYLAIGRILPQYLGSGGTFQPGPPVFSEYYFWNILFWRRGFFSYMPAMLFIVPALLAGRKTIRSRPQEFIVLLTMAAAALFYGLFTNEYGGWAYGFRYLIPLIPLVWFFIAREYAALARSWQYAVLCCLIGWGVIVSYVGAYNPWCSCYEASRSPPSTVDHYVRCTFAANLLCISFEYGGPDSALFRFLERHIYGPPLAAAYLKEAFTNTKNIEKLVQLREYCRQNPQTQMKFERRLK